MISSLVPCTESLFGLLRPLDLGPMVRPHCYRHQVSSYSYPKPPFQNEAKYQTFLVNINFLCMKIENHFHS